MALRGRLIGSVGVALALTRTPVFAEIPQVVVEPHTEHSFPVRITSRVTTDGVNHDYSLVLLGTGARALLSLVQFKFLRAHSLGLYFDEAAALKTLNISEPSQCYSGDVDDGEFTSLFLGDHFVKSLRLVSCRQVNQKMFFRSLRKQLESIVGQKCLDISSEDIKDFIKAIEELTEEKGIIKDIFPESVIDYIWCKGGVLLVLIDGEIIRTLKSKVLCWSLFSLYIGNESLMPKTRVDLEEEYKTWRAKQLVD